MVGAAMHQVNAISYQKPNHKSPLNPTERNLLTILVSVPCYNLLFFFTDSSLNMINARN